MVLDNVTLLAFGIFVLLLGFALLTVRKVEDDE